MSDYKLPELPSDEELGIAGLSEEDLEPVDRPAPPKEGQPPPPRKEKAPVPSKPEGPRWRGWAPLAALLLATWMSSSYRHLPSPLAANAPDSVFSSGRALSELVEVAQKPRPIGSPEHDRVREFLMARLQELGLQPTVQETTQVIARRDRARAATVRNIVARLPGTSSTGALVLTAHYDAVPGSPGAGDDATGLVTVLEALRAIQAGPALRNDLIVLFTDAEEEGLLGARAFVERHDWMSDVQMVLSVEMRGAGGPSIMFETGSENGWVIERLQESDPRPLANSSSMEVYRRLPNDTDFTPFREVGIQGLNFAAIGRANRYHQATDTPENLREATVQHHGVRLLAMTRALGDADFSEVRAPDRSYTTLPFLGMISLPVSLTIPVSAGLVLALLVVTFMASLRGARSRGFLLAAILSAVAMALSAGAGWAMVRWAFPLHGAFGTGAMTPPIHAQGPYTVALVALALGFTITLFSLGHRWMSPLEATLGALLFPVVSLVAVTFMAPAAAINLQGPLAATIVLLALLAGVGLHRARGNVAWIASVLLAVPVLAFLVPVLEFATLAFTLSAAPVIAAMITLALLFILPALSALDFPNRWWAPLTAFTVAGIALGSGWLQRDPSAERPAPSTLLYVLDRDGEGLPVSARWASLEGPGTEWASQAAGGVLADTSSLQGYGFPSRSFVTREAPLAAVPAPEVRVYSDTVVAGERRVSLGLRSRVGAEYVAVQLPDGVDALSIWGAGSGQARPGLLAPSVRWVEHWGRPEGMIRLDLVGSPNADWTLELVEQHLRPEEIFGEERFTRPADLGGYGPTVSDRVTVRTPYVVGSALIAGTGGPGPGDVPGSVPDSLVPADSARAAPGAVTDTSGVDSSNPDTIRSGASLLDSGGARDTEAGPRASVET